MQIDDIRFMNSQNAAPREGGVRTNVSPKEDELPGAYDVVLGSVRPTGISPIYQKDNDKEESVIDSIADKEAHYSDATSMKRQLSMAAAGFSVEDFDEAKEEGYDLKNEEPDTIITVSDQIKMKLLEAGKDISGMGGLSSDKIAAMTGGNAALAASLEKELAAADLPTDDEVISDAVAAVRKGQELEQPSERVIKNLLAQQAPPTIENVYAATFSQKTGLEDMPKESLPEETVRTLYDQVTESMDKDAIAIDDVRMLLEEQIPVTPENLSYMKELQKTDLTLASEEILDSIKNAISEGRRPQEAFLLPGYSLSDQAQMAAQVINEVTPEVVSDVVNRGEALTIDNIKKADNRIAHDRPTVFSKEEREQLEALGSNANRWQMKDVLEGQMTADGDASKTVRALRTVEEARLVMTKEANLSLLKQGISIDTTELETLVDELKDRENAFYKNILGETEPAALEQKMDLFDRTNSVMSRLGELPALLLGRFYDDEDLAGAKVTPAKMYDEGMALAAKFRMAGERYETMRTEIRHDLGDSIKKAFSHLDEMFSDMDIEQTPENERAVRILGYNTLPITEESIASVRGLDEQVQRMFKNLTPGVVAKMIREGENPLDLSIEEVNEKAEEIKAVSASDSPEDNFARFLWKADRSGEFTDEERAGIVGVYRLIYQVEKTDGAVIGQLLHEGADITLRNMMGAVRTRKHENREYTVDDNFGFSETIRESLSITEQIEMAFQTNRMRDAADVITPEKMMRFDDAQTYLTMSPDAFATALSQMEDSPEETERTKELDRMEWQDLREAVDSEAKVYDILQRYDLPQSPANLEAFSQLLADRNSMYRRLFHNDRRYFGDEEDIAADKDMGDVMEDVMKAFGEAVKKPEDMAEAQRKLEDIATNVMKNMLMEEQVGTIDVRGMQIAVRQIKAIGDMSKHSETYAVPITVADETGNLSLKIVRGKDEQKGLVDVALQTERLGNVYGSFRYEGEGIIGTVSADSLATRELVESILEKMQDRIAETSGFPAKVGVTFDGRTDANNIFSETKTDFEQTKEQSEVQTRTLYGIARSVIDVLGEIE